MSNRSAAVANGQRPPCRQQQNGNDLHAFGCVERRWSLTREPEKALPGSAVATFCYSGEDAFVAHLLNDVPVPAMGLFQIRQFPTGLIRRPA